MAAEPDAGGGHRDRRWPRWVYGVGEEPDARFTLANERTFLAWIRTGLGFVAAGMAAAALAGYAGLTDPRVAIAALLLVGGGVLAGVIALLRWMVQERAMRLNRPLTSSTALPLFTVVLVVVAVLGLTLFL
ncbi:YidH family protein [Granulicoccus sp. GXG6511]|uniref:YidH family protein n=1 Tax=Granulicoccus sp. GXG6511 TaxID=3381351 RepID=UPI003D7EAE09